MSILQAFQKIFQTLPASTEINLLNKVNGLANNQNLINQLGVNYNDVFLIAKDVKQDLITPIVASGVTYNILDDSLEGFKVTGTSNQLFNLPASGSGLVNPGHTYTFVNTMLANTLTINLNGNSVEGDTTNIVVPVATATTFGKARIEYYDDDEYVRIF
jgi:hypothetical protein